MPITQAVPNSFKEELFQAEHNFNAAGGNVFKLALYTSAATLNSATTVYTSTNEVANSGQYTTGGGILVNVGTSVSSGVAYVDFADISFTGVTLTARGALIYNSTTGAAVAVLDFGNDKTATSTFTVTFPTAGATTAIIRFS